mmetsp:Transcript_96662/g.273373  ORF Transcript_96662/g.273373 Transcript_96662/m.273373 type:complete len:296 (+) Transcript_96662:130-1017(+)
MLRKALVKVLVQGLLGVHGGAPLRGVGLAAWLLALALDTQNGPELGAGLVRGQRVRRARERALDLPDPEAVPAHIVGWIQRVLHPQWVETVGTFACKRMPPWQISKLANTSAKASLDVLCLRRRPPDGALAVQEGAPGYTDTVELWIKPPAVEVEAAHKCRGRRARGKVLQETHDHEQQPVGAEAACVGHAVGPLDEPLLEDERDGPRIGELVEQPADDGLAPKAAMVRILERDVHADGAGERVLRRRDEGEHRHRRMRRGADGVAEDPLLLRQLARELLLPARRQGGHSGGVAG